MTEQSHHRYYICLLCSVFDVTKTQRCSFPTDEGGNVKVHFLKSQLNFLFVHQTYISYCICAVLGDDFLEMSVMIPIKLLLMLQEVLYR